MNLHYNPQGGVFVRETLKNRALYLTTYLRHSYAGIFNLMRSDRKCCGARFAARYSGIGPMIFYVDTAYFVSGQAAFLHEETSDVTFRDFFFFKI